MPTEALVINLSTGNFCGYHTKLEKSQGKASLIVYVLALYSGDLKDMEKTSRGRRNAIWLGNWTTATAPESHRSVSVPWEGRVSLARFPAVMICMCSEARRRLRNKAKQRLFRKRLLLACTCQWSLKERLWEQSLYWTPDFFTFIHSLYIFHTDTLVG